MNTATKPLFLHGPSALVRLVLCAIVAIALMVADHRGRHLELLRGMVATFVYPLQYAVDLPIQAGAWLAENVSSRTTLLKENDRLRKEQLHSRARLEKFAELESENRRLRGLLDSSARVGEQVLIAELLSVDMNPYSRRVVLNKGSRDGVRTGQAIIDSFGVMGQIVHTGPYSSNALLITDPGHALPVQVQRSGLRAVAVGAGPLNRLNLVHIPNDTDIRAGDVLVTSGLGERFPAGYAVGKILAVERDRGRPFATVTVEPAARLERNREVLVVWPTKDRSLAAGYPAWR